MWCTWLNAEVLFSPPAIIYYIRVLRMPISISCHFLFAIKKKGRLRPFICKMISIDAHIVPPSKSTLTAAAHRSWNRTANTNLNKISVHCTNECAENAFSHNPFAVHRALRSIKMQYNCLSVFFRSPTVRVYFSFYKYARTKFGVTH